MSSEELIRELDVVMLVHDLSPTLLEGMRGTVVHDYAPEADIVLVEFVDEQGETFEQTDVPRTALRVTWKYKG
jgi:hypothetical protein